MDGSSFALLQNTAILAHRDAGGGAVHSINSGKPQIQKEAATVIVNARRRVYPHLSKNRLPHQRIQEMPNLKLDVSRLAGINSEDYQTGMAMRSPLPKTLISENRVIGISSDGTELSTEKLGPTPKLHMDMTNTVGISDAGASVGSAKAGTVPKLDFDVTKTIGTSNVGISTGAPKAGVVPK
jgi:hypothetical protein